MMPPLAGDPPRSRILAVALVADPRRARASRRSCSPARSRSTSRPRSASSSCSRRATTCCSAIPASSRSPTRCSSASAATASRIALYRWARAGTRSRSGCLVALPLAVGAGAGHRPVLAAGAGDLLRHDHARGGIAFAILASQLVMAHRRRGRPHLPRAGIAAAGLPCSPARRPRRRGHRADADLLPGLRLVRAVLFLLLLRVVNSPFGRVLQAIRENEFRAEALGYRTVDLPHARQLPRGGGRRRRRRALRAVAALHRARTPR